MIKESKKYSSSDVVKAFELLGLEVGDYDKVDRAYKVLAKKHHPDLTGGSDEMMKRLNDAKDALEQGVKLGKSGKESSREMWDRINKEHREGNAELIKTLQEKMSPILETYAKYLEAQTGKPHKLKLNVRSSENGATLQAEWINDDKDLYFTLSFWLRYSGKPSTMSLGTSQPMPEFDAYFESYMFIGGKKIRIGKREWKKFDAVEFKNPEEIFPSAKIKKSLATSKDKPIKRADFLKFLEVTMNGHTNGDYDWWYIPLGKRGEAPHALALHRTVMLRQAMWYISIAGTVGAEKYKHYSTGSKYSLKDGLRFSNSFYENRKLMDYLPQIVKEAKKASEQGSATQFQVFLDKIKDEINKQPTSEAKLVDLIKECVYDQLYEFKPIEGEPMKTNLSESYMKMFNEEDSTPDHVMTAEPTTAKGQDGQDNDSPVVEQAEGSDALPQKLTMAMDRLSKKPTADKVELQAALLQEAVKVLQSLPQAQKLLKDFAATAHQIVLKGEPEAVTQ